ncbi:MAG: hypothetical protein ACLUKN_13595 [Bacilli bacterium]
MSIWIKRRRYEKAVGKRHQVLKKSNRKYLSWHPFEALNMALWDIRGKYCQAVGFLD